MKFERHLAEKIIAEKEVGKEAAGVSALPAVPPDLFCSPASFCFIYSGSEFTQLGAVLKSDMGFFCCSPKGRGAEGKVAGFPKQAGKWESASASA